MDGVSADETEMICNMMEGLNVLVESGKGINDCNVFIPLRRRVEAVVMSPAVWYYG
jgi:hypothetical protein